MESIRDIAKWFLSKESMRHKKLQKLCYYAQAWHCAFYDGEPLFEDEIQAWAHGPVIPTLFAIYSSYKWTPIPKVVFDESKLDEDVLELLENIYATYGGFTGNKLEAFACVEPPWQKARGDLQPEEICTNAISCQDMTDYYGGLCRQERNNQNRY